MLPSSLKARMLEAFRFRMYFIISGVAVLFLLLIVQLINLQLIHAKEYKVKSRLNMESYIPISASRGEIYDRNYKNGVRNVILTSNRSSFNITTVPAKFKSQNEFYNVIMNISRLLNIQYKDMLQNIKNRNPWERMIIVEDVGFDTIVKIASHQNRFPNINWEDAPVRVYNFSDMCSHVIGYIGSISRKEYIKLKKDGYKYYHKIGKSGIEKQYDKLLRGKDGFFRRIVDVRNRTEGEEVGLQPVSGNNIVLTLDYEVQKTVFDAMHGLKGAVIVIKPSTGEIIALVSKPDFDPNQIILKNNKIIIEDLINNKNKPFLNRTIQSKYPPASTLKLLTAISALETEKSYPSKKFYCPGKYTLKGYIDKDFYCYAVHGNLDLVHAISKSCTVYFFQLGYKIGPTSILRYADYFGLDEKTGIDIPREISGFVPSKKWKLKTFGQPWFDGDTLNLSIGQGFISVTPIGMANFIAGIINNGIVYRPQLVKEVRTSDNKEVVKEFKREKIREIPLSPLTISTVKQGMRLGVTNGTSIRLRSLKFPVAGKTGTAQTRSRRKEDFSQHAWFIGFAPYNEVPEKTYAAVVLVEYGIAGAVSAVPVAQKIFSKLYELGYLL